VAWFSFWSLGQYAHFEQNQDQYSQSGDLYFCLNSDLVHIYIGMAFGDGISPLFLDGHFLLRATRYACICWYSFGFVLSVSQGASLVGSFGTIGSS
jgi:hypothetical protein